MKTKTAMFVFYPSILGMFAGMAELAGISARHYLSAAVSRGIAGVIFALFLLLWMVMLWNGRKYKENPEITRVRNKPAERITVGLLLLVAYGDIFCSNWPAHQSLASVESRWQFVFLAVTLLLAFLLLVPPSAFRVGKTRTDARPRTLKVLLPRLIGFTAILIMLQVVLNYWQIRN